MYGQTRAHRQRTTHVPEEHHKRELARLLCSSSHVSRVSLRCEGATSTTLPSPAPQNTHRCPSPCHLMCPKPTTLAPSWGGWDYFMSRPPRGGVCGLCGGGGGGGSLRGDLVRGYRRGEVPHGHRQAPRVPLIGYTISRSSSMNTF